MRPAVIAAAAAALSGSIACKAQVHANAEANVRGEGEVADFNKPMEGPVVGEAPSFEGPGRGEALLGARPDLSYRGPASATCKCLQVAVGQPGDASFQWSGERPHTNPSSQLVIAMSSSGMTCPDAHASDLGASYWGYEMKNDDVIVVVEPAVSGRPLTSGAIIPRPLGSGHVFVRPADKNVPYGRSTVGGNGMCSIGQFAVGDSKPRPSIPPPSGSAPVRIRTEESPADSSSVTMP